MIRILAVLSIFAVGSCGGGGLQGERLARSLGLPAEVGPICGDGRLLGVELPPVDGAGSCGISDPVQVYAVGTVLLSPQPRLRCEAARALKDWSENGARPALRKAGTQMASARVAASYACRRRNNAPSGRLSEHAKGNAIDLSAFTLTNGDTVTVKDDWRSGKYRSALREMHRAACGPFGVVLGPEADRHHQDHFHFDISNMDRKYCR